MGAWIRIRIRIRIHIHIQFHIQIQTSTRFRIHIEHKANSFRMQRRKHNYCDLYDDCTKL